MQVKMKQIVLLSYCNYRTWSTNDSVTEGLLNKSNVSRVEHPGTIGLLQERNVTATVNRLSPVAPKTRVRTIRPTFPHIARSPVIYARHLYKTSINRVLAFAEKLTCVIIDCI